MTKSSKVSSEAKVMDVSKPGKGKIVGTSRPVVAPLTTAPKQEDSNATLPDNEPIAPLAPSATKKVIQPLSIEIKPDETESQSIEISTIDVSGKTAEEKLVEEVVAITTTPAVDENVDEAPADESEPADSPESTPELHPVTEDKPEETLQPAELEPAADPKPETEESKPAETESSETSDAAGVDAIAEQVNSKKEAAQKAEEQAKRDAELHGLIESKKYVVPIGHDGIKTAKHHNSLWVILVLILITLLAGTYLLVDAKVIKVSITLPYEFIKEDQASADSVTQPLNEETANEATTAEQSASTDAKAQDDERKNELKNLQQKLETYFNDNDEYPETLSIIKPALTTDELTGPDGDAYTYTPSADQQTYVLSASLENKQDKDADADGNYVLNSVNQ